MQMSAVCSIHTLDLWNRVLAAFCKMWRTNWTISSPSSFSFYLKRSIEITVGFKKTKKPNTFTVQFFFLTQVWDFSTVLFPQVKRTVISLLQSSLLSVIYKPRTLGKKSLAIKEFHSCGQASWQTAAKKILRISANCKWHLKQRLCQILCLWFMIRRVSCCLRVFFFVWIFFHYDSIIWQRTKSLYYQYLCNQGL